ncbi:YcxB family protein [Flavobacterium ginsenosidimutans]|uniref:YcxB family protein n=1 Tax=Flavobacterium ginsenosidimutans TaxID=687844 RepID=UPI003D96DB85
MVSGIIFKENILEVFTETIGKSEFNFSAFKNISEIKDYFFIAFKTGESLMIPKDKIEDAEKLRNKLKSIAENLKIDFISELDWKWK